MAVRQGKGPGFTFTLNVPDRDLNTPEVRRWLNDATRTIEQHFAQHPPVTVDPDAVFTLGILGKDG